MIMKSIVRFFTQGESGKRMGWFYLYFGGLLGLRLLFRGIGGVVDWSSLLFVLGGFLGLWLWVVDRLVYVYWTRPKEGLSVEIKKLVSEKKYREVIPALESSGFGARALVMSGGLFLAVWCGLALFVVTSTPGMFAKGFILGIGLDLLWDLKKDWSNKKLLKDRLFWQVQREISLDEMKVVLSVFGGCLALSSFLAV